MKINSTICDNCKKQIQPAENLPTHHLELKNVTIRQTSLLCNAIFVHPILENDMDFCSKECLKLWISK